jgi:hypothetical protein
MFLVSTGFLAPFFPCKSVDGRGQGAFATRDETDDWNIKPRFHSVDNMNEAGWNEECEGREMEKAAIGP